MQPAERLAARERVVARPRLAQELLARAQGDDGVDGRVQPLDPVEKGRHHLDAGEPARADRPREIQRVELDRIGGIRHRHPPRR